MHACRAVLASLAVLIAAPLAAQPWVPGVNYYGPSGQSWIVYRAGDMPLILTAPHGGELRPSSLPDRTGDVTTTRDSNTTELSNAIAAEIYNRSGRRPHQVSSLLHRIKLDPNREIYEAALGHPLAETAYHAFHDFVTIARGEVVREFGRGFLIDVHGHGHTIQRLELGYTLSTSEINYIDWLLDRPEYLTRSSIRTLAANSPTIFSQLLRGPNAFGTLIMNEGYRAVPSLNDPSPGSNPYFAGGYITQVHTSVADGGPICGFQMECHSTGVRNNATNRAAFAVAMANAIHDFFRIHYGVDLGLRPQVRLEWIGDRVAEGGTARLRLHRAGDRRAAMTVQLVLAGTAASGADFTAPPGTINLPAQASYVDIVVPVLSDAAEEGTETIVASVVVPAGAEVIGAPSTTLHIEDAGSVQVWVEAVESEVVAGGTARFRVRRTAGAGVATVGLAAGGTARAGWDYADGWPPATVTLAAGVTTVDLEVPLPAESRRRPDRALTLTVAAGPGHRVGIPGTAEVVIASAPSAEAGPVLHLGGAAGSDRAQDLANANRRIGRLPDPAGGPQAGGTARRPHWSFDGFEQALFVPPLAAAPDGAFTVAIRFRTASFSGSGVRSLLAMGGFDQPESVHLYMLESNRQLRTVIWDGGENPGRATLDAGTSYANNTWHHYALVVAPGQPARVYVNGVHRVAEAFAGAPIPTPQHLWIGWREGNFNNRYWPGQLADLRWYHRALTDAEITDLAADTPGWALWKGDHGLGPEALPGLRDAHGHPLFAVFALGGELDRGMLLPRVGSAGDGRQVLRWLERADISGLQVIPERLGPGGFIPLDAGYSDSQETFETIGETWRERTVTAPAGAETGIIRLKIQG